MAIAEPNNYSLLPSSAMQQVIFIASALLVNSQLMLPDNEVVPLSSVASFIYSISCPYTADLWTFICVGVLSVL